MSFLDYLIEIDPQWLLNRVQIWNLFHATWSNHPNVKVFFFEDYKKDAFGTLVNVLRWLDISEITEGEILRAVESSAWEKAKLSEEAFLRDLGLNSPQMIRTGSTIVENRVQELDAYGLIDEECGPLHNLIRSGKRTDSYIRTSPLSTQVIEFLRRSPDLVPFVFTPEEIAFRFTGLNTINQRTIELSTQNQKKVHLIASIQRRIIQNFVFDIKLLTHVKFGTKRFSGAKFLFQIVGTLAKILIRRTLGFFTPRSDR